MLFDDVIRKVGEFGPYQIGLYCLLGFVGFPSGLHSVAVAFLGLTVDHWCDVPELNNLSYEQQKLIAAPIDESGEYSRCRMYNLDYSSYSPEQLANWNRTTMLPSNTTTRECSAWLYDTSEYNSVVNKWDLVCDDAYLVSLLQTVYMAGFLSGCVGWGQVSDRWGRKKAVLSALVVQFFMCIVQMFVPIYQLYAFVRFVIGTSVGGSFTGIFVMCMEMIGPRWRMETGIFVQGWFAGGIMLVSFVAWLLSDLFKLHLFMILFLLLFIPYFWIMPESPRWLVSQGRTEEAEVIIRKMAKINRVTLTEKLVLCNEREEEIHKGFITDLFKGSKIRVITITMWFAWFVAAMDYYGLSLGVDILPGSTFLNVFFAGAIELPSYVMTCILLNKVGRRMPNAATLMASGLCCVLMTPFIANSNLQYLLSALSLLGKFFCSAAFAIVYVYAAELFPTVVRNVGVGSSSMCARFAGLLQPQIQLSGLTWAPLPYIIYGACSILAGIVSCFLPETLNRRLPETLEDVENFHNLEPKKDEKLSLDAACAEPMVTSDATSQAA